MVRTIVRLAFKSLTASLACLPLAGAAQAPCTATVTEGIFSSSISCSSNGCSSTCAANSGGVTAEGISYSWCQCGSEAESDCCRVVMLDVLGPDTPKKLGACGIPGCLAGRCALQHSGLLSVDTTAVCIQPAAPELP